jgi:hypothetical protein
MHRRNFILSSVSSALLTACGGGGDDAEVDAAAMDLEARRRRTAAALNTLTPQQTGLRIADFILSLQQPSGAIKDDPGGSLINEDSNMQYALIGLAAAYAHSGDPKYLEGLRAGVEWLGSKMTMDDPRWNGSYPLSFNYPSYSGNYSTRGVDATSSLFPYCVHLHQRLSGSNALRDQYEPQIRAALQFLDTYNTCADGFSLSSWVDGQLWAYEYTADQMDVYLGWEAARRMFPTEGHFVSRADFYRTQVPAVFFLSGKGRYALGRDHGGAMESAWEGFNGIFPNGYLPWTIGPHANNTKALQFLESCIQANGSIRVGNQTRAYTLSAATYLCGCAGIGRTPNQSVISWLCNTAFDPQSGGVNDSSTDNTKYSNVAGFCAAGLLGFLPFA